MTKEEFHRRFNGDMLYIKWNSNKEREIIKNYFRSGGYMIYAVYSCFICFWSTRECGSGITGTERCPPDTSIISFAEFISIVYANDELPPNLTPQRYAEILELFL